MHHSFLYLSTRDLEGCLDSEKVRIEHLSSGIEQETRENGPTGTKWGENAGHSCRMVDTNKSVERWRAKRELRRRITGLFVAGKTIPECRRNRRLERMDCSVGDWSWRTGMLRRRLIQVGRSGCLLNFVWGQLLVVIFFCFILFSNNSCRKVGPHRTSMMWWRSRCFQRRCSRRDSQIWAKSSQAMNACSHTSFNLACCRLQLY